MVARTVRVLRVRMMAIATLAVHHVTTVTRVRLSRKSCPIYNVSQLPH